MSVSAVVDTVIGLSFAFFVLSLAASAIAEWLATVLQKRAKYLLRGLRAMVEGSTESVPASRWTAVGKAIGAERKLVEEALRVLDGTGRRRPTSRRGDGCCAIRSSRRRPSAGRGERSRGRPRTCRRRRWRR